MTLYLRMQDLLQIATQIGQDGQAGVMVRDPGLLESALARPRADFFGKEAYPTLEEKAAALMHSIATNHALVDGNKRLAFLSTAMFLWLNGRDITATEDQLFDLTLAIADGGLRYVPEIAAKLTEFTRPRQQDGPAQ